MIGNGLNSYADAEVTDPAVVVTITSTVPADFAGVLTVTVVEDRAVIVAAVPPKVTLDVAASSVPVMTTLVPPTVGPLVTSSDEMVGAAK